MMSIFYEFVAMKQWVLNWLKMSSKNSLCNLWLYHILAIRDFLPLSVTKANLDAPQNIVVGRNVRNILITYQYPNTCLTTDILR